MERLTKRDEFGNTDIIGVDSMDLQCNLEFDEFNKVTTALNKLAKYEDLEEKELLLELPCKPGDIVYDVVFCDDGKYHVFEMKVCNINPFGDVGKCKVWNVYLEDDCTKAYRSFYDFNKTVFLEKEAAEKALKEMEDRKNGQADFCR